MTTNNQSTAVSAIIAMGPGPFYLLALWLIKKNGHPQTVVQLAQNVLHGSMTPPTIRTNLLKLDGLQLATKTAPPGTWTTTNIAKSLWDNEEKNFFLLNSINTLKDSNSENLILNNEEKIFSPVTEKLLIWSGINNPTRDSLLNLDPVMTLAVVLKTAHDTLTNDRLTFRPGLVVHNLRQTNLAKFDFSINPARLTHESNCFCDSCSAWRNSNPIQTANDVLDFITANPLAAVLDPPGQFADFYATNED